MSLYPADIASETQAVGMEDWNSILAAGRTATFGSFSLGGDSTNPHPGASYANVPEAVPFVAPSTVTGTWKLRSFLRCEDASVTITLKLRDLTAGADVASSTTGACSGTASDWSGTNQHNISSALTLVAGHLYVAWAIKSATTKQCYVDAVYLERTN